MGKQQVRVGGPNTVAEKNAASPTYLNGFADAELTLGLLTLSSIHQQNLLCSALFAHSPHRREEPHTAWGGAAQAALWELGGH